MLDTVTIRLASEAGGMDRVQAASPGKVLGPGCLGQSDEMGPQIARTERGLAVGEQGPEQRGDGVKWTRRSHSLDFQM